MQIGWVQEPTSRGCNRKLPLCGRCPLVGPCLLEEGFLIVVCQEDGVQDQLAQTDGQVLLLEQLHHWPVIKGVLQAGKVDSEAAQALAAGQFIKGALQAGRVDASTSASLSTPSMQCICMMPF